MFFEAD